MLNEKIIQLVLEKGEAAGSTGVVRLEEKELSFTPAGKTEKTAAVGITYEKRK